MIVQSHWIEKLSYPRRGIRSLIVSSVLPWIAVVLSSCTTVTPEMPLPSQRLGAPKAPSMARLVFFNDTNLFLFPTSNLIGIKLDGKGVGSIHTGEYLQIDIPKGDYTLELSHFDVIYFVNRYPLSVQTPEQYLKIYCTPVTTRFERFSTMPDDLQRYRPGVAATR